MAALAKPAEMIKQMPSAAINNDSQKNWLINWFRKEPTAFRMPISFALFSLRAVLRFIKLMQASSSTNIPIIPNSHTYSIAPPVLIPFLNSEYKCHLLIGCRKITGLNFVSSRLILSSLHIFYFCRYLTHICIIRYLHIHK